MQGIEHVSNVRIVKNENYGFKIYTYITIIGMKLFYYVKIYNIAYNNKIQIICQNGQNTITPGVEPKPSTIYEMCAQPLYRKGTNNIISLIKKFKMARTTGFVNKTSIRARHMLAQRTLKTALEIQSMQSVQSTQIQQQSEQINRIQDMAVNSHQNLEKANKLIKRAKDNLKASTQTTVVLLVLSIAGIIFLDKCR
ncbi:Syntaxin_18 [Hexamita inflata]|uniref:Syntaxin_18 n=1 Tax=Hexamita inflata TaxID=28002 RepID=A0ABP1IKW5_9EUKA